MQKRDVELSKGKNNYHSVTLQKNIKNRENKKAIATRKKLLFALDMLKNKFTRTILIELISSLKNLKLLNLFENYVSGNFPTYLSQLIYLLKLDLSINKIVGKIPIEFQRLISLVYM